VLIVVTISLAALVALAGLFQFWASRRDAHLFPPPGRMIDIGGRRLHVKVEGHGLPTVVFEAGISASSVNWVGIQPQVAEFTTTCSYDRAGLAWSDLPRGSFDAGRMVADLAAMLDQLNLPAPYVLVGHSFGGLLVRIFAERYPAKVAGLVLIDPVLACTWQHPGATNASVKRRAIRIARGAAWCARFGLVRLVTMPAVVQSVIVPLFGGHGESAEGVVDRLQTELVKLPPAMIPVFRSHWCRPKNYQAMVHHLGALESSFAEVRNQALDCPLIVLSAGTTSPEGLAEHRAIAATSSRGEHIVAQHSGHWIQFDEPQLVIDAIRRVGSQVSAHFLA
jgi:pimeloyl-ACP methyl ester carboxylesterase